MLIAAQSNRDSIRRKLDTLWPRGRQLTRPEARDAIRLLPLIEISEHDHARADAALLDLVAGGLLTCDGGGGGVDTLYTRPLEDIEPPAANAGPSPTMFVDGLGNSRPYAEVQAEQAARREAAEVLA